MFTVLKFNNIYRFCFCLYSCSYGCVLLLAIFLKRKYIIAPSLLFSFPQLFYISLILAANVVSDETEHYILFLVFNCLLGLFSFSSVAQSCPTLQPCGLQHARLPCPHQLPEITQIHVHRVGDAIQPSHPLSSPSPPALNLSQHQGLFR